jgi:hypothetical protein
MFATQGVLDEVEAALDRLNGADPSTRSVTATEEAVLRLERIKAKLAAAEATLCREYQTSLEWKAKGALHPSGVVAATHRIPSKACRRPFTIARKLAELPALLEALAAGQITVVQRDRILAVDNPRVHAAFVADHAEMVDWATQQPWGIFCARLQWWLFQQDPDGKDPGVETRGLDCSQTWRDRWVLNGELDAVAGTIFANELQRLERGLFEQDWAEARDRHGRDPEPRELARTPRQRRADALVLMAERSATGPEDNRRGTILFSAVLGSEALWRTCQLTNGVQLTPGQLTPYLDDRARFETILLDPEMRNISASKRRLYRGALRRMVLVLTGGCFHPYCDKPPSECEADHQVPHSKGGPTTFVNGQGACDGHNAAKGNKDPTQANGP